MNFEKILMALVGWVHPVKDFKAACLHHKCEGQHYFHNELSFHSSLISLLPQLFSYLHWKKAL